MFPNLFPVYIWRAAGCCAVCHSYTVFFILGNNSLDFSWAQILYFGVVFWCYSSCFFAHMMCHIFDHLGTQLYFVVNYLLGGLDSSLVFVRLSHCKGDLKV